ncbi:metallophosphoesterase [Paenibacillus sp. 32O-W]|uniref:bifunctional metallophosphatase/5'-nucleotidase n=1 Tax=Paenibacillus sp. 32O-W TaxID=1695218 RepID=UPI000720CA37|nr:bifunctional UDP-sugar hydrolase/5'-nucleotidase [Paenibacillus sp. 32O-W]ALS26873.1 metallophosphoesterase [Paenibacillus sp. 32O-W]
MRRTLNESMKVLLLHSNDIHSRLEQAAKMAGYIADQRRVYGSDRVLVVDCGDHMDRMRLETEGSDGLVNIELLNAAGYEAFVPGNNEGLTYPMGSLAESLGKRARFAVLGANMRVMATGERPEWLQPGTIVKKGGLSIGLIGVTAAFADFYKLLGWQVTDPLEAVREQVRAMRSHTDVLVVMSHLGLPLDRRMAEEIEGIDLILGGHTHHLLEEPLVIGHTTICAAGKFGERIGRVEIGLDPAGSRPVFRAECVPVAAFPEDAAAAGIIGSYREAGERRLSRVIARLDAPLPASTERESPLGNLLAAGLRRHADAEIGIVNAGQLLGGLAKGDVTAGQLHALCPSPINPCRMKLAGSLIRQALEESLLDEFTAMPIRGFGFRGEVLGALAVDGLDIVYDPDGPDYGKIRSISVNGSPFDERRQYVVGTIDMFTFGVGYKSLREGREIRYYLPEFIRDIVADCLGDPDLISRCRQKRWKAVGT